MPIELLDPNVLMLDLTEEPKLWNVGCDFFFSPDNIPPHIWALPEGSSVLRTLSEKDAWGLRANFLEYIQNLNADPEEESLEEALSTARLVNAAQVLIVDSHFKMIDHYKV